MKLSDDKQQTLLEKFKSRPAAPAQPSRGEVDFTKQLESSGDKVEATLRADKGTITEGTALKFLQDEGLNPDEYEVVSFRKSQWSGFDGQEMESVRFNFRKTTSTVESLLPDLDDLHQAVKKSHKSKVKLRGTVFGGGTGVIGMSDLQVGKVDILGGTQELLERLEVSLDNTRKYLKRQKFDEVLLVDPGDAMEGFNNTAAQAQTNDLRLTEQIRVMRRIWWGWVNEVSMMVPSVKVAGVPSNHARVRQGKNYLSEPHDDFGIEMIAQLHDLAQVYPERYGHVSFYVPADHADSLAIETVDGTVVGLAHGDQANNQNALPTWLAGQALGNSPVGNCHILITGHWHNLRVQVVGNNRTIFTAPCNDGGSSWFTNKSGNSSATGILAFKIDKSKPTGWTDLEIL